MAGAELMAARERYPVPDEADMLLAEEQYNVPGPGDPSLVSVTELPGFASAKPGEPWFNGIEHLQTREVTITGVRLTWDGTIPVLSAMRTTRDVTRLTVIADEVVIDRPLAWKGADVTIVARRLAFRGAGCIVTSPEPYGAPAFSEQRDDRGRPLDPGTGAPADGKAGLPGCRAGDIRLRVRELDLGESATVRFECRGGDGQKGETGGHIDRPDKKPTTASTVSMKDVEAAVHNSQNSTGDLNGLGYWYYPGGDSRPSSSGHQTRTTTDFWHDLIGRGYLEAGTVTHVRVVFAYYVFFGGWHFKCVDLPKYSRRESKDLVVGDPNRPYPPVAYPSGTSGAGGAGGNLTLPDALRDRVAPHFAGGGGGSPLSDPVEGRRGKPESYQVLSYEFHERSDAVNRPRELPYVIRTLSAEKGQGCPGRQGPPGANGTVQAAAAAEASWLDPRLLRVVLNYARRQASMGHREEAFEILQPYYDALPKAGAPGDDAGELATMSQAVQALVTNIAANLDPYGNPGGWVPRFSANSYFQLYYGDRAFSYRFVYVMGKALALADSVEHAAEVLDTVASQNEAGIDQLHGDLGKSYAAYHDARDALDDACNRFKAVQDQLDAIQAQATKDAQEKEKTDRIVKAVFTTAGAICTALPVGQPYLAGVGTVLNGIGSSASALDPSQPAFDQALQFLGNVSGNVGDALAKNADTFKDQFNDRLKAKYRDRTDPKVMDLRSQIAVGQQELTDARAEVDTLTQKTYANVTSNADLASLLKKTDPDKELLELASDREALKARLAEADRLISDLPSGSTDLAIELAAKKRQNLVAMRAKLYAQIGALDSTVAEKRKQAAAAKDAVAEKQAAMETMDKASKARDAVKRKQQTLDGLLAQLDEKTSAKADEDARLTFKTTLATTQKMAKGLSDSAGAIRAALRPVSADDQDVQALRDKILSSSYKEMFEDALAKLEKAKAKRAQALQALEDCNRRMLTGLADLQHALETSVELSRNRQALAAGIDAGVKLRMQAMAQSAAERMDYYLYLVRKAYLYEQLTPIGEGMAQVNEFTRRFDSWLAAKSAELKGLPEQIDLTQAQGQLAAIQAATGSSVQAFGDSVLKETLAELTKTILDRRQLSGVEKSNKAYDFRLSPEDAEALLTDEGLSLRHVADLFDPGDARNMLSEHRRLRVAEIALKTFDVEWRDDRPRSSVRLELTAGRTFPIRGDDDPSGRQTWYLFRLSDREEPIRYGFNIRPAASGSGQIVPDTSSGSDAFFQAITSKETGTTVEYREMSPSLLSSLKLELTMGAHQIRAIRDLTLTLTLTHDG